MCKGPKTGCFPFSWPKMLRVRYDDFKELLYQNRRLFTDYILEVSSSILIYEFFMPLSREDRLREALDNLFYRDTIEQRIQEIGTCIYGDWDQEACRVNELAVSKLLCRSIDSCRT